MTTKVTTFTVTTRTTSNLPSSSVLAKPAVAGPRVRLSAALGAFCLAAMAFGVGAQSKPAVRHTVDGTVINAAKAPVAGAIVYLENPKSLDVQSYLTDDQGRFHFNQISPQTDYDVWAEQNGVQSKHKFISQFSSHIGFHFVLKLAPDRKKFLGIF